MDWDENEVAGLWPEREEERSKEEGEGEEGIELGEFFGDGVALMPVEVALHVFEWLDPASLARAELVCRQWRATIGPASPHLPFLWRAVHEAHFGSGAAAAQRQAEEEGAEPRKKETYKKKREVEELDWRAKCLRAHVTRFQYMKQGDMGAMLKWVITCGHHVVLRDLIRNSPQAVAALQDQRLYPHADGHLTHLALIGSDLRVVDLVAAHAGVPPSTITRAARSGSLHALELLVRHFVDQQAGLLSGRSPIDNSIELPGPITEEVLDQLDQALKQGGLSVARLFLLAGEGGHVGLMRPLLERSNAARRHELLMTTSNRKGNTAFLEACATGRAEVFAFLFPLLSDDQIRTAANRERMTGLLLALHRGDVDMARAFLDRGASANGDLALGPLPLAVAVAAERNRIELVSLLLERGADINKIQAGNGKTCLIAACGTSRVSYDVVKLLLDKGADLSATTQPAGWSVTGRLLQSPDPLGEGEEKLRVARLLLERGAPLVAQGLPGNSGGELVGLVLRWFVKLGRLDQFRFERAEATTLATLQLLIDYGCTAKDMPPEGLLPLVATTSPHILRYFVAHHGLSLTDDGAVPGLALAAALSSDTEAHHRLATVRALLELGVGLGRLPASIPAVHYVREGEEDLLALLVAHGADVNAVDQAGGTILHRYMWQMRPQREDWVRALHRFGVDFGLRDHLRRTALDCGRLRGRIGAVMRELTPA